MLTGRREECKVNKQRSGISEEVGDHDPLPDGFIFKMNEADRKRRREKDEASAQEEAFTIAGGLALRNAVTC